MSKRVEDDFGFGDDFEEALSHAASPEPKSPTGSSPVKLAPPPVSPGGKTGVSPSSIRRISGQRPFEAAATPKDNEDSEEAPKAATGAISGWLTSRKSSKNTLSRKNMIKEKWYELKNNKITWGNSAEGAVQGVIQVQDIEKVKGDASSCSFDIKTSKKTFKLLARTESECADWLKALNASL